LLILFELYFIFNSRWRRSLSTTRQGWCKENKEEGYNVRLLEKTKERPKVFFF